MAGQPSKKSLRDRILEKCVTHTNGCIVWQGYALNGYGKIRWKGGRIYVHRAMYELAKGAIQEGLCACHKCDNPLCVNPDHLFLGSRAENNADKVAKDRQSRGATHAMPKESHPLAKLTQSEVDLIKVTAGVSQRELARMYGVSQATISLIRNNHRWGK